MEFYKLESRRFQEQAEKYHEELMHVKTSLTSQVLKLKRELDIKEDELNYVNGKFKKLV